MKIYLAKFFIYLASIFYDRILCFSNFVKSEIGKEVPFAKNKIKVVYHGPILLDELGENNTTEVSYSIPYILYVGNNRPHKNLEILIQGFKNYCLNNVDLSLIMAGNQIPRFVNTKDLVESQQIQDRVIIFDKVSNASLKTLYENCEFVVYPSLSEGFGFPLLEAWYFKKPILTSKTSCLPEIGGKAAYYINPNLPNDISNGIEALMNNKKLKKQLVNEGERRLKSFNWTKSANEHLKIFRSL